MNQILKLFIILLAIYLLWAFWHHKKTKTLSWQIMIEYLLIAALVAIIIIGIST